MDTGSVESLFIQLKQCIVECRSDILRAMISAVESTDKDKLRKLMQFATNEGSLLHIACQRKMLDGIRILLNSGVDPRLLNDAQKTALAESNFHPDIVAVFLQHCIQLISQANTEGLSRMLQIGISVNSLDRTDSQQNSLLHWACHFAQPACVRLLLERSANPNLANRDGVTPLHLSIIKADLELVRLLIQFGANPSVYIKHGPYADKNGFDLCSQSDKSVLLMQAISQQQQQQHHQLSPQQPQGSAAHLDVAASQYVANGADGASAAASTDDIRARPLNGADFAKDSVLDRAFWPRPQQCQLLIGQHFRLPTVAKPGQQEPQQQQQPLVLSLNRIEGEPALRFLASQLSQFRPRTLIVTKPVQGVSLEIGHRVCRGRPEGYYLEVTGAGVRLMAADLRGLFNGAAVLSSLLTACAELSMGLVPGIRVWDWPTTLVRGVLIDCSSGLLPRPEALISIAESAACMRANQLHLFFRLGGSAHACPYAQEDLRRVTRTAEEDFGLTPVLGIDIGVGVADLGHVQSQAEVLVGAFPPDCPLHLGPRLSAHLAQGPEQEAPAWLGLGRQHLYLASSGFALPAWLQKLPITCIDHCLPRDRPEDRAAYLHSALPSFVLAPATGAWLSFTGCHSLHRAKFCPGLARSLTSLPGLSGIVSCDWDGGGIGPHLITSLPAHSATLGLAWNPAVLTAGGMDDSSVAGAVARWLPEPLAKLEPAESAVSQADKPSPFQALFCGLLPEQEIELRPVPKLNLKPLSEGTAEERLVSFTAELALLCYHMLAKPMSTPAQRTDCANRVIKLKQAARPAWAGMYLSTQHLNTALATFDTLVSRLLNSVDLPDL